MIEIRRTGLTGGPRVFAVANIRRGTRLAAESPLITVPPIPENDELPELCKAIDKLPDANATELANIFCPSSIIEPLRTDLRVRNTVWAHYKAKKWKDDDSGHVLSQGPSRRKLVRRTTNLCVKFLVTSVQLGPSGKYGSGVFPIHSRIGHSCEPNAHNAWNPTIQRLTLHATRDIRAGEEVCVDYTANVCRTRRQRAFVLLSSWGVNCRCAACTQPAVEKLRHRMLVIDGALAAYACGASSDPKFALKYGVPSVTTPAQALRAAEELVQLLRKQRLYGMELCRT